MAGLWSAEHKIVLERRLWLAVLRAQPELGVDVPDGVVADYEAVVDQVDLASIAARERVTRHDVKARIEEFSDLAGHEHIHKGMTSRDLTENVEQLQVRDALVLVRGRMLATLALLAELADSTPRPSSPGAATTCRPRPPPSASGSPTPARSCWWRCGASTSSSPATRCAASRARSAPSRTCSTCSARPTPSPAWRRPCASHLGFKASLDNVGQVYPRSLDLDVVSALVQAAAGTVEPGHHPAAHGRPGAGHRGVQAGPGRLVGHAPQDELPVVRAGLRLQRHPRRPPHHGQRRCRAASGTRAT